MHDTRATEHRDARDSLSGSVSGISPGGANSKSLDAVFNLNTSRCIEIVENEELPASSETGRRAPEGVRINVRVHPPFSVFPNSHPMEAASTIPAEVTRGFIPVDEANAFVQRFLAIDVLPTDATQRDYVLNPDNAPVELRPPRYTIGEYMKLPSDKLPRVAIVGINDSPDYVQHHTKQMSWQMRTRDIAKDGPRRLQLFLYGPSSRPDDPMRWRTFVSTLINALMHSDQEQSARAYSGIDIIDPEAREGLTPAELAACMKRSFQREKVFYTWGLEQTPCAAFVGLLMNKWTQGAGTRLELGAFMRMSEKNEMPFVAYAPCGDAGVDFLVDVVRECDGNVHRLLLAAIRHIFVAADPRAVAVTPDRFGNPTLVYRPGVPLSVYAEVLRGVAIKTRDANAACTSGMPKAVIAKFSFATASCFTSFLPRMGFGRMPNPGEESVDCWVFQPAQIPDLVPPAATAIGGSHCIVLCRYMGKPMLLVTVQQRGDAIALESLGGAVNLRENHRDAAFREVKEESGLDVSAYRHTLSVLKVEGQASARPGDIGDLMVFWCIDLGAVDELPKVGASHETLQTFWADAEEVARTGSAASPIDSVTYKMRFASTTALVRQALAGERIPVVVDRDKRTWATAFGGM